MNTGLNIEQLAAEIARVQRDHRDYLAPTTQTVFVPQEDGKTINMRIGDSVRWTDYGIMETAHDQIGNKVGIPAKYYDRMRREAPGLLADNVNHWLSKEPERRLIRTLDGNVRAFLSDRYRPLDNYLLAEAVFPVLLDQGEQMTFKSSALTETRLYIQAVSTRLSAEVRVGDVVQAGVVISNSEIGKGSFSVETFLYFLRCTNGMISGRSMRRNHVGKRIDQGDNDSYDYFTTETIEADNRAFTLKVRDTVRGALSDAGFQAAVNDLRAATERQIEFGKVDKVIEEVTSRWSLNQGEADGIVERLARGGDFTQYGLAGAVTNLANSYEVGQYDRIVELERIGGEVIALDDRSWMDLAA